LAEFVVVHGLTVEIPGSVHRVNHVEVDVVLGLLAAGERVNVGDRTVAVTPLPRNSATIPKATRLRTN